MKVSKLLLVVLVLLVLVSCSKDIEGLSDIQEETIIHFVSDGNDKNYEGFYNVYASNKYFESEMLFQKLDELIRDVSVIESYSVVQIKVEGSNHLIEVHLVGKVADRNITFVFNADQLVGINGLKHELVVNDVEVNNNLVNENKLTKEEIIKNLEELIKLNSISMFMGSLSEDSLQYADYLSFINYYKSSMNITDFNKVVIHKTVDDQDRIICTLDYNHSVVEILFTLSDDGKITKIEIPVLEKLEKSGLNSFEKLLNQELFYDENGYGLSRAFKEKYSLEYNKTMNTTTQAYEFILDEDYEAVYLLLSEALSSKFSSDEFESYITLLTKKNAFDMRFDFEAMGGSLNLNYASPFFKNRYLRINETVKERIEFNFEFDNSMSINNIFLRRYKNKYIYEAEDFTIKEQLNTSELIKALKTKNISELMTICSNESQLTESEYDELYKLQKKLIGSFEGFYIRIGTSMSESNDYENVEYLIVSSEEIGRLLIVIDRNKDIVDYNVALLTKGMFFE